MFDAYAVSIKLRLIDGVSAGLLGITRQTQALNKHIGSTTAGLATLERKMLDIRSLGMAGGFAAVAGGIGLLMFKGPLEEAKKFQIEAAKFASLGFGSAVNGEAVQFAKGMNTIGTSARDNMSLMGDAMAVFKDLGEAKMVAPLMAKMKYANQVTFGAGGGERDQKLMDMMKVIEFRGGTSSPEEFARQANFAQQAITGSRNRVDPTALLLAMKTGGVALSRRSNEAFYLGAEPLLQEFGGSRYGTAAMSIYQNLVQARGTITAQQELYRLGLLDKSKVSFNSLGMLKKALPGAFTGSGVLENEGELALLEKVLLPAFAKKGVTGEENILRELGMILGNRTGSSLMSRIYQQRAKLHMQTEANYHAENLDQSVATAGGTLKGKEVQLHARWATLMNELGIAILPMAIWAIEGLTSVIKTMTVFARNNQTAVKFLVGGLVALSAALAIGGVILATTAAFKGLGLAVALFQPAALAGAATSLAAFAVSLGSVAAVAGAGYLGWQAGGWLNDKLNGGISLALGRDATLGTAIFDMLHPSEGGKFVSPSGSKKTIQVNTQVNLDGRSVGNMVSTHLTKGMTGPQRSASFFDTVMAAPPVGASAVGMP